MVKAVKIMPCSCKSEFQDKQHGKHKRLFNRTRNRGNIGWRCTVCGFEKKGE